MGTCSQPCQLNAILGNTTNAAHEHFVFVIDEHLTSQRSHSVFHYPSVVTVSNQQ
ncbi:hypothetical protein BCR33DRAFT_728702, partial [Rhizoclosmatium globosum]